ncbi:TetR/AcrR family transcriptional regulator [Nocardia sp. FBN12]|uniref:TetR/AcrR family transcriptional regulator n=1 Tax=Nocardia sp. FBN12 TaxID=3419766 RepID=UPI003CFC4A66
MSGPEHWAPRCAPLGIPGSDTSSPDNPRGPAARVRRRQAALAAAQEVFVAHGYHGATMDEICMVAGMSKPVLYGDFTSKLDLYLAVLQHYLDRMVAGLRAATTAGGESRDKVRRAVLVYFDFVEDDAGGYILVFESSVPSEPCVQWRVRNAMRECAILVSAELRASGVEELQADAHAWSLVGAAHLTARHWLDAGRPISKNEAVEAVVALCWDGLPTSGRDIGSATV